VEDHPGDQRQGLLEGLDAGGLQLEETEEASGMLR